MSRKFAVMGVIVPTSRCARMPIGKVRKSQFLFGILIPSFRKSLDSSGDSK